MQGRINLSIFLLIFLLSLNCQGSHIVGGEITYEFIAFSNNQTEAEIEVTLTLYRDPQGIPYDALANFGVFVEEPWGAWRSYDVIRQVPVSPTENIPNDSDPCKTRFLSEAKMELATYTFRTTLEIGNSNYQITYQKCCRNYTINNIIGTGGDLGSVYDILITPEALRTGSSSPVFSGKPPIFVCANFQQQLDQSAIDKDGDALTYSFCDPLYTGPPGSSCGGATQNPDPAFCPPPYPGLEYLPPYTTTNPMDGSPRIVINSDSGFMTGVPQVVGSYVVGVCIEETRNGILLSRTRRDYEFNVVDCYENLLARVRSDTYLKDPLWNPVDSIAYFETCDPATFEFINESEDQAYIQDYKWTIHDPKGDLVYDSNGATLRDLSFYFADEGQYEGMMILNDGADCYDTAFFQVYHIPDLEIITECVYDTCIAGAVNFQNYSQASHSDVDWGWDFGDGNSAMGAEQLYEYELSGNYDIEITATDTFGCITTESKTLDWYPYELTPPDTINIDTLLCYHDSILIYQEWILTEGTYFNYLPSMFTGCDSIVERINVFFTDVIPATEIAETICAEDSYFFDNKDLNLSGTYEELLTSHQNCDSLVILSLTVREDKRETLIVHICPEEEFLFGDSTIINGGIYTKTFTSAAGCDSIVDLTVIEVESKFLDISAEFCSGEPFIFDNEVLDEGGIYRFEYISEDNLCDSTVTLILTENFPAETTLIESICEGGYIEMGSVRYMETGDYDYLTQTDKGCDSLVSLDLTVLPDVEHEFQDTICLGEVYPFGSVDLTQEGIYYDTLFNSNGCDSLVILDLVVGQNLTKINVEEELEESYGETLILEPNVSGGDLITSEWFESEEVISNELVLVYVVQDDNWLFFESTNDLYCVSIDSVFVRARIDINIYFPNIISPDGDGFNDLFNIGASETVRNSQLFVYDRWGNQMYIGAVIEDRNIGTGWDGTFRNEFVQNGTYAYLVKVEFINGERKTYSGEIQVLR